MARPKRSANTTIRMVAAEAGVSESTVSRVMNDRFLGEARIAERVREVAAALRYTPSPLARGLALGETRTIAFVVPDLGNPSFQEVLHRLTRAAAGDGYRVLIADSGESPEEEAILAVQTRLRCDSIVLCAPRMPTAELARLAPSLQPLVLINRPGPDPSVPSLSVDYRTGVAELAGHLHGLGHRSLAYVAGPENSASNAARIAGLTAFAAETGVRMHVVPAGSSTTDGHAATDAVLETGATAALAFNDLTAVGLLTGLAERGLRVPADISVTGFDDILLARHVTPPLTTASVPWERIGTLAWRRLHELIRERRPGGEPVAMFAPRVVLRESTGPAPT